MIKIVDYSFGDIHPMVTTIIGIQDEALNKGSIIDLVIGKFGEPCIPAL